MLSGRSNNMSGNEIAGEGDPEESMRSTTLINRPKGTSGTINSQRYLTK